jgi:hypothetical protein
VTREPASTARIFFFKLFSAARMYVHMHARTHASWPRTGGRRTSFTSTGVSGDGSPTTWNKCCLSYCNESLRVILMNFEEEIWARGIASSRSEFISSKRKVFPAACTHVCAHARAHVCTHASWSRTGGRQASLISIGRQRRRRKGVTSMIRFAFGGEKDL